MPAKCATPQVNVDFYDDDLKTVYDVGARECCSHCAQTKKCKAYTFVNYNGFAPWRCYLKTGGMGSTTTPWRELGRGHGRHT